MSVAERGDSGQGMWVMGGGGNEVGYAPFLRCATEDEYFQIRVMLLGVGNNELRYGCVCGVTSLVRWSEMRRMQLTFVRRTPIYNENLTC